MFTDENYANAVLAHTERRRVIRPANDPTIRHSPACADNRCGECEWDANVCDCEHHFEQNAVKEFRDGQKLTYCVCGIPSDTSFCLHCF